VSGSNDSRPWTKLPQKLTRPLERFLDCLENDTKDASLCTADEAAYRSAVMEALYRGAKDHTWTEPAQPQK
jgi:hypothetical protein